MFPSGRLGEGLEDSEAGDYAAGVKVDGAGGVPCLQFPDRVGTGEVSFFGSGVDVDVGVFVSGFAVVFECFSNWRGVVRGQGFKGGHFNVFVFRVFRCDCSNEVETKFELRV